MLNIWVGNLGKYNEGELKGGWLELPKEKEEIDEFLKEVVGLNEEYEEYMINDFETDLPYKVSEYESIKMLNLLAKVSENIYNMEAIEGYANSEGNLSIEQLMNIIIQEDEIPYYSYQIDSWTMSAEEKYGYRFAKDTGLLDVLKQHGIEGYFDFESYQNEIGYRPVFCAATVVAIYANHLSEHLGGSEIAHKSVERRRTERTSHSATDLC